MKIPCPNCGHFKLEHRYDRPVFIFGLMVMIGVPLCLVLLGFIIVPIGVIGAALSFALLKGDKCTHCGWTTGAITRGKSANERYQ